MTNNIKLEAPWETVNERMKESNINLTDADLEYEPGKEDELLPRLGNNASLNPFGCFFQSFSNFVCQKKSMNNDNFPCT